MTPSYRPLYEEQDKLLKVSRSGGRKSRHYCWTALKIQTGTFLDRVDFKSCGWTRMFLLKVSDGDFRSDDTEAYSKTEQVA